MKKGILFFSIFFLVAFHSPSSVADGGYFDDYATRSDADTIARVRRWALGLPVVGKAFHGFILCSERPHAGPDRFDADFEACWSGYDQTRSCAYRCGGETKIYGFYAPSEIDHSIQYAIVCRCENLVHRYDLYPVPSIVPHD